MFGQEEVRRALAEDRAGMDLTTRLLGVAGARPAVGRFVAEGAFVVAGVPIAEMVFRELDPAAAFGDAAAEGTRCDESQALISVRASASVLLAGERVALNFLQRLSGIATLTRRIVDTVAETPARITHTRKTTPGLRALEQYAVRMGGGVDNRASLADAVMWKDNHWTLLGAGGRSLSEVLSRAPAGVPVIVEVETEDQLQQALEAGVSHLLVDNQSPETLGAWARRAGPGVTIQASGGITIENARAYAEAGAGLIAIGALTHSVAAAPIRCDVQPC